MKMYVGGYGDGYDDGDDNFDDTFDLTGNSIFCNNSSCNKTSDCGGTPDKPKYCNNVTCDGYKVKRCT
jgi:hypothetical protein